MQPMRRRSFRGSVAAAVIVGAVALLAPASASAASVTIGKVNPNAGGSGCDPGKVYTQQQAQIPFVVAVVGRDRLLGHTTGQRHPERAGSLKTLRQTGSAPNGEFAYAIAGSQRTADPHAQRRQPLPHPHPRAARRQARLLLPERSRGLPGLPLHRRLRQRRHPGWSQQRRGGELVRQRERRLQQHEVHEPRGDHRGRRRRRRFRRRHPGPVPRRLGRQRRLPGGHQSDQPGDGRRRGDRQDQAGAGASELCPQLVRRGLVRLGLHLPDGRRSASRRSAASSPSTCPRPARSSSPSSARPPAAASTAGARRAPARTARSPGARSTRR